MSNQIGNLPEKETLDTTDIFPLDAIDGITYHIKASNMFSGVSELKGDKGDPFLYSDFTPQQLAALKGEPGTGIDISSLPTATEPYSTNDKILVIQSGVLKVGSIPTGSSSGSGGNTGGGTTTSNDLVSIGIVGNQIVDTSSFNRTLNISGVTIDNAITKGGLPTLKFNGSAFIDLTGGWVNLDDLDFTISFDLYQQNLGNYCLLEGRTNGNGRYINFAVGSAGELGYYYDSEVKIGTNAGLLQPQTFQKITLKRVSLLTSIKVNTTTVGTYQETLGFSPSGNLKIGKNVFTNSVNLVGNIANFKISLP